MAEKSKALSFQEPFATTIAVGIKSVECRSRNIKTPVKDLVVCSSKTARFYPRIPGFTYGYAIGLVDIVSCEKFQRKDLEPALMSFMPGYDDNAWQLENARLIKPFPVKATASFFYVDNEIEVIPTTIDAYKKFILPVAEGGSKHDIEMTCDLLFNHPDEFWNVFEL